MLQEDLSVFEGGGEGTIMPSPDPDGPGGIPGGADKRTVTITSGQELVWQEGAAAGMLEDGQFEVLVDDGRLVFGNFVKAKIQGKVFLDKYKDGYFDSYHDKELKGIKIILSLQETGQLVDEVYTDEWGHYYFEGLIPGVAYKITQIQPHEFKDGPNIQGEPQVGEVVEYEEGVVDDMFTNIVLSSGDCAEGYDFIEHYFSKRDYTSRYAGVFDSAWTGLSSYDSSEESYTQDSYTHSNKHFKKTFDSLKSYKYKFKSRYSSDHSSDYFKDDSKAHDDSEHTGKKKHVAQHSKDGDDSQKVRKRKLKSRKPVHKSKVDYEHSATQTGYHKKINSYRKKIAARSHAEVHAVDSVWTAYGSAGSSDTDGGRAKFWSRYRRW